jgi:hypothetical protein
VVLATVVASDLAVRADEEGARPFQISVTEDFWFLGCPDGVDPNLVDTCGTATGHPFGQALVGTIITGFSPLPSGCFRDSHTSTFDYGSKGTLVVEITGDLCPAGGRNFNLLGGYRITGGTGIFADARGEGAVFASRENGPIHSDLDGLIQLRDHD